MVARLRAVEAGRRLKGTVSLARIPQALQSRSSRQTRRARSLMCGHAMSQRVAT
jgi:hypothetical protein